MSDLLSKLSSYNLFNYLLPGVVFAAIASELTKYTFLQDEIIVGVFIYYFIGLVISRVGSILFEPLYKKLSIVRFSPYGDYISASEADATIKVLSETNNMYRTFCSLFFLLIGLKIHEIIIDKIPSLNSTSLLFLIISLFTLFTFSYRKQTKYVSKRIENHIKSSSKIINK